ncbi:DNA mismatch repair endonuclease MutL, partial [Candidatus Ruminimicrobium bovinum]|uniref:DNA mismatch repair endonuclease MutL n=1 Tax=Candidatus Ruminimicrobium bovinum TaxID=3242779 RepID=UPI0039B9489A
MTIKILDDNTINKIAAGEVVERPLNVVKELLENSLDAGAKNIIVEIEKAGKKTIRITDDGCGMDKDDILLCVCRHATSKISQFDDLSNVSTLGFRGEALASIAAVSMLDIKTQVKNSASGWQYYMEGGRQAEIKPWAGSGGTIVEVKNLFFNTPVREKFLKSDTTEKAKIISCIDEIALVRNDVKFKIISDGKTIADYNITDSKIKRIEAVLGKDLAGKLKHITVSHPNINIETFITSRQNALAQKNMQYLFVNGRCVNYPRWLMHAINQAQKQAIPVGKYIGIVIYLNTEQENIDINIHPTKREIKFAYENQ